MPEPWGQAVLYRRGREQRGPVGDDGIGTNV